MGWNWQTRGDCGLCWSEHLSSVAGRAILRWHALVPRLYDHCYFTGKVTCILTGREEQAEKQQQHLNPK